MQFATVNAGRFDPYRNFKFRISWDGRHVAAATKMSGLSRTTQVVRAGTSKAPQTGVAADARVRYEPIRLERGVTHDPEFERWTHTIAGPDGGPAAEFSLNVIYRELFVEVINEAGKPVRAYRIRRCWVSECASMADLDADANAVILETLVLQNEGWERVDPNVIPSNPPG